MIADESHFLKNAQAKRTTASLPVIKVITVESYNHVLDSAILSSKVTLCLISMENIYGKNKRLGERIKRIFEPKKRRRKKSFWIMLKHAQRV